MALPNPATGDTVQATDVTGIKNHLEGASGSTAPYKLRQSAGDAIILLPDAAGATALSIHDSADVEVASIDSDGNGTFTTVTLTNFDLPTGAAPSQTIEGRAVWDTDDDALTIGSGTATLRFRPEYKGSDIASAAALNVGASGSYFDVTGTTTITSISTRPAGDTVVLQFDGSLQITHNSTSLIMSGAINHFTYPNEVIVFKSEGSGNWRMISSDPFTKLSDEFGQGNWRNLCVIGGTTGQSLATGTALGVGMSVTFGAGGALNGTAGTINADNEGMQSLGTGTTSGISSLVSCLLLDFGGDTDYADMRVSIALDNSSNRTIIFGLKANGNAADENNMIAFRVTDNGNILGVCDSGGTETTRDSGFAGGAGGGTEYRLRILISAGTVRFYVNDSQVLTDVTTNIPTETQWSGVNPYFVLGISNSTTADRRLHFRDLFGRFR